jgi:hypothetical protein
VPRVLPAVVAAALLGVVVAAGLAGQLSDRGGHAAPTTVAAPVVVTTTSALPPTTAPPPPTTPAPAAPATSSLRHTIGKGMYGSDVQMVQQRLKDLGFEPGPIDGAFGDLTRAAVWAYEKLVLGTPSDQATGTVTDEMWQRMQDPITITPRRSGSGGHTEVYLPEQVVAFFVDDRPVLISHMSSGTGEEWCDEVTISPGEIATSTHGTPEEGRVRAVDDARRRVPLLPACRRRPPERPRRDVEPGVLQLRHRHPRRAQRAVASGIARLHPHPAGDLGDVPAARR